MFEFAGIVVLIFLVGRFLPENRFKGIDRQQAIRRALMKVHEKYHHFSF